MSCGNRWHYDIIYNAWSLQENVGATYITELPSPTHKWLLTEKCSPLAHAVPIIPAVTPPTPHHLNVTAQRTPRPSTRHRHGYNFWFQLRLQQKLGAMTSFSQKFINTYHYLRCNKIMKSRISRFQPSAVIYGNCCNVVSRPLLFPFMKFHPA